MKALTLSTFAAASLLSMAGLANAAPGACPMGGPGMGAGMGPGMGPMGPRAERMLERFDTNKDGKITQDEINAVKDKEFADVAQGADGVTIQQFEPWFWKQHREMMVRAFQRLDRDGDGKVTKDEMDEGSAELVKRLDRNGDGVLSPEDRPAPPRGPAGWFGRGDDRGPHHGHMGKGRDGGWGQGWRMGGGPGMQGQGPCATPDGEAGGPVDDAAPDEAPAAAPAP